MPTSLIHKIVQWSDPLPQLLAGLGTTPLGLSQAEAKARMRQAGPYRLNPGPQTVDLSVLVGHFLSLIILSLLAAPLLSFALNSVVDGVIILVLVVLSGPLGFSQERRAAKAAGQGPAVLDIRCTVMPDVLPEGQTGAILTDSQARRCCGLLG